MATPGTTVSKFTRTYVVVNPSAAMGPDTHNLSVPNPISDGGGGGGGVNYSFDGDAPIDVDVSVASSGTVQVNTSMDIQQLPNRP